MELQPLQQLRELSLQGNQAVTDVGLDSLARLQSLEALDLQLCWQVRYAARGRSLHGDAGSAVVTAGLSRVLRCQLVRRRRLCSICAHTRQVSSILVRLEACDTTPHSVSFVVTTHALL